MSAPNDIIYFHYPFSPYARRVSWYLALRKIPYAQCLQPPMLPRPDLESLNVAYRRIPLLSIGSSILCDTRLILSTLESQSFPDSLPPLGAAASDSTNRALERLLSRWTTDAGVFMRAAQQIPPDMPLLNDPRFLADRTAPTGRKWSVETQSRGRPEALAAMRDCFALLEETLLADGREWIAGGEKPSFSEIEAIWPFDWLIGMKALPDELFGVEVYPKTHAWLKRFAGVVKKAMKDNKPVSLKGGQALQSIANASGCVSREKSVEGNDPSGLKSGDEVEVWPIDSGFGHRDRGHLVVLTRDEVAIEMKTKVGGHPIRLHAPRWGFRVEKAKAAQSTKL